MKKILFLLMFCSSVYGQQINLQGDIKGTLPVANGGTGCTTAPCILSNFGGSGSSFPGCTAGSNGISCTGPGAFSYLQVSTSTTPTQIQTTPTCIITGCTGGHGTLAGISSPVTNLQMMVADGLNAADCTTGGGITTHWCYYTGFVWASELSVGPAGVVAAASPVIYNSGTQTVACPTCSVTVASGTATLGTSAIASAACASVVTVAATGVLTTDVVLTSFNGDPTAVTGYIPSTSGMLTIFAYPTAGAFNAKVCNNTSASITPGTVILNWRVTR